MAKIKSGSRFEVVGLVSLVSSRESGGKTYWNLQIVYMVWNLRVALMDSTAMLPLCVVGATVQATGNLVNKSFGLMAEATKIERCEI